MRKSKIGNYLFGKYKEERHSYRVSLDLKKHNWLIQKFKSVDKKSTKREKKTLKRLNKNIKNSRAKVVVPRIAKKIKTPENGSSHTKSISPKLNSNDKIGNKPMASQSMPNITDSYNEEKLFVENNIANQSYQIEPLALLNKSENRINNFNTIKSALLNQSGKKLSLDENKSTSVIGNMEEKNNMPISVQPPKNKSLMDNMTPHFGKHDLPLSAVPEMKKYRQAILPSDEFINFPNIDKKLYSPAKYYKDLESQTDRNYMEMLQFLQAQKITTVEKLKDILENNVEAQNELDEEDYKILEYLKTKKITLHKLTEIINKADDKLKEENCNDDVIKKETGTEDDLEFVKIETPSQNTVSSESVEALVALSAENKRLIYLYTKYNKSCNPEGIKYELDDAQKDQRNQSVILQAPGSIFDTTIIKPTGVQQENSYNYNDVVKADPIAEDDDRLVIDEMNITVSTSTYSGNQITQDICNKIEDYSHHGSEPVEDISSEVNEYTHIHVAEDVYCQATEVNIYQVVEETSSNVVNLIEQQPENIGFHVEQEPSHLSFQETGRQVAIEPNITPLAALNAFKVPKNPSLKKTRRGKSQMGTPGVDVQKSTARQENKRRHHLRDPKIKFRQQLFAKPQSFNQHGSQVSPRSLIPNMPQSQIRPRAFKHLAAVNSVNQNLGFDRNSHIASNDHYHPSNQSNNIVGITDNQYGLSHSTGLNNLIYTQCNQNERIIGNDPNNQNNSGLAPNTQFVNEANPQNDYNRTVKSYGTSGQNYNVIYNASYQSGGTYAHNSQAGSFIRFAQCNKMGFGGFGQQSHNNVHSSLIASELVDRENNVFWDQVGQSMPSTTIANIVDQPLNWPATSMGNLTGYTGANQSLYPPPRHSTIAPQYANTTPESLWHTRRWPHLPEK